MPLVFFSTVFNLVEPDFLLRSGWHQTGWTLRDGQVHVYAPTNDIRLIFHSNQHPIIKYGGYVAWIMFGGRW
jgi:hypothetical protein